MRTTKNFALILCLLALFIQSCSTTKVYTTVKSQDISQNGILTQPKIANLSIDAKRKINGKSTARAKITNCPTVEEMKHQAEYDALKTNNADVLIEPIFKVTVTDMGKIREITAEVSGYAGTYTEFKDFNALTKDEVESLKAYADFCKENGTPVLKIKTDSEANSSTNPINALKKMMGGKK